MGPLFLPLSLVVEIEAQRRHASQHGLNARLGANGRIRIEVAQPLQGLPLETPTHSLQAGARQYAVRIEPAAANEGHAPVVALLAEAGRRQQHLVVLAVDATAARHHLGDVPLQQAEGELQFREAGLLALGHLVAGQHPLQHLIGPQAQGGEDGDGHQHLKQGKAAVVRWAGVALDHRLTPAPDHGRTLMNVHRLR